MSVRRDIDSDPDNPESFASRWSRRKQEALPDADSAAATPESVAQEPAATTARELTDADMPDPDSLQADSDFAAFMSPKVSEGLRARALRRLFSLPGLHTPDGLDDYDEDFVKLTPLGDMLTHDMRRMLARESGAKEAEASTAAAGPAPPESLPAEPDSLVADEDHQPAADQTSEDSNGPQRPV